MISVISRKMRRKKGRFLSLDKNVCIVSEQMPQTWSQTAPVTRLKFTDVKKRHVSDSGGHGQYLQSVGQSLQPKPDGLSEAYVISEWFPLSAVLMPPLCSSTTSAGCGNDCGVQLIVLLWPNMYMLTAGWHMSTEC